MLLSTLVCAHPGCRERLYGEADMWHIVEHARDIGWSFDRSEERAWCPLHEEEAIPDVVWVVGCYTCDFEEDFRSEEEAKDEYMQHDCEPDTYIWNPDEVAKKQARRAAMNRPVQVATVNAALSDAAARQDLLERYAANWLRLRNFFLFWKKTTV
jgi:hypothetical protein